MKNIIILLFLLFITILADTKKIEVNKNNSMQTKQICKDLKAIKIQQRGCCSWHGGVSGCSDGRIVCNDGTYSPSCTCVIPVNPLG